MVSTVRRSQEKSKYKGAKDNKDAKRNFELLYALLADYLYLHF